jgi:RND family efflux transporter MFP subunit
MNFKKFFLFIIIPVLLFGLIVFFFTRKETIKVKKITVQNSDVVRTVSASGFIKSNVEAEIAFPVAGKIVNLYKKEGDVVNQGDLIAQVYSEDAFYEAESAKQRRDAAQRAYDIYVTTYYDRPNRVGGQDIYELNLKKLREELSVQDNLYKASLASLKKTYLYAPFSGTLTKQPYNIGEVVSITNTVTLSDLNSLEFQADLDQEDYKFVKLAQESEIVLDAYPEEIFSAKVTSVPFFVDEDSATRTFKIKLSIDSNEKIVKGMTGDVNIIVDKVSNTKSLPFDAIFTEDETSKKYVWVTDNNNALKKQYIEVGLEGDILTQITSEIPEFVVIPESNSRTIKEGTLASF